MHTPIEFYVKLPADLFRGATPTKHKFDYLRTVPPRKEDQTYDMKTNPTTGMIDHTTSGLSIESMLEAIKYACVDILNLLLEEKLSGGITDVVDLIDEVERFAKHIEQAGTPEF